MQRKKSVHDGLYSPNQSIFFVVMVLLFLIPFLGSRLAHPAQNLKNIFLKNIYSALTAPLVDISKRTPLVACIPTLREAFIHTAGLTEQGEWDTFFYHQEAYDSEVATFYAETGESSYSEGCHPFPDRLVRGPLAENVLSTASHLSIEHPVHLPLKLFLFGDSQMHSLAAGMLRALGSDKTIKVQELSVPSSGFLRSDYYNWPKKLATLFASQKSTEHFDAAVIFLGMNDYQDMWTTDGIILMAGTPEWENVYRKMVKKHLNIVLQSVPRLYWFSLPTVRNSSYNQKLQYLNSVHASIAEEYDSKRVVKISLRRFVEHYEKSYIEAIRAGDGSWVPFMQSDGIHYTIEGGEYLMKCFIDQLHRDYGLAWSRVQN